MRSCKKCHTILIVDDEQGTPRALQIILQNRYNILTCDNAEKVIDIISSQEVDVVMLDIRMPGVDGLRLLKAIKATTPATEVVLITAYPSMQSAIEAIRYGAYDYIIKPFDVERIRQVAHKGIVLRTQGKVNRSLASNLMSEIYEHYEIKKKK